MKKRLPYRGLKCAKCNKSARSKCSFCNTRLCKTCQDEKNISIKCCFICKYKYCYDHIHLTRKCYYSGLFKEFCNGCHDNSYY